MRLPRKERQSLEQSDHDGEQFPSITVAIEGENNPENYQQISVLDINDSGMGITCEHPLKVGQTIKFIGDKLDFDVPEQGTVMWTFKADSNFQAGIKFSS